MTTKRWTRTCASAAALSFALAGVAAAQTPGGAPTGPTAAASGGATSSTTLADIVVTAQKREQNLQNVPIVVTVAGAQLLQDAGVRDIKDLTVLTPGLLVTSTASEASTTARIRGIGTVGDNPGLESSVGVVIDGVYRPRNGVGFGDLGELSRVEVLKGPQGTVFGKNTSAGVINILTAQPSFKFGANAEFTTGNYGEIGGSAAVTGPLIADKLAGSLFFAQRTRDGFSDVDVGKGPRNVTDDFNRNFYTVRGQLYYTPTEALNARLILDYSRRSEDCCVGQQIVDGPTAPLVSALAAPGSGLLNPPNPFRRLSFANRGSGQAIQDGGASLEINYTLPNLGGAKLTSITAARDWQIIRGEDSDFTGADILYRPQNGDQQTQFQQFSQELRLGGSYDKLDYTIGVFYAHELLKQNTTLLFGNDYPAFAGTLLTAGFPAGTSAGTLAAVRGIVNLSQPGTGQKDVFKQDDETFAIFTNNTYHLTDKIDLTGGIRYTTDDKSMSARYSNTDGGRSCAAVNNPASQLFALASTLCQSANFANPLFDGVANDRTHSETAVTGTGKISYRFSPEYLTYFSYSRGYKSGGFNIDRVVQQVTPRTATSLGSQYIPLLDTSFPGEFADSYELGLKTTLLDRKLLLNGALFYQEFSNFQLNAFNGLYFTVISVPLVKSAGADFDVLWRPMRGLTVQGGLTYANTRYPASDASVLGSNPVQFPGTYRLSGSRLSLAPLVSLSTSVTYERPVTDDLLARFNVGLKFNTGYNTGSDLNPVKQQGDYAVVDARIGIGPRDKRWSVELWSQNLFDEGYYQVVYDAPFQTGSYDAFLGQPRTFGVTLRARY